MHYGDLLKKIGITHVRRCTVSAACRCTCPAFAARLEDVSVQFSIGNTMIRLAKMDVIAMEESPVFGRKRRFYPNMWIPYTNRPNRYPTAEIVLKINLNGYTFKSSSESYFNLFGGGAEYLSARKSGDSSTLTLTVEFENMGPTSIGRPASVSPLDESGLASWTPVGDASSYGSNHYAKWQGQ